MNKHRNKKQLKQEIQKRKEPKKVAVEALGKERKKDKGEVAVAEREKERKKRGGGEEQAL